MMQPVLRRFQSTHSGLLSRRRPSVQSGGASVRQGLEQSPSLVYNRGATNCAMKRGRWIVCCARWPITGANSSYGQVSGEMGYFRHNRDKMDYAAYQAAGLIISSGPVEANGQNHRRTPAQTQWHALDGKRRRRANSQPPRSRAVQALGYILGLAPTTFRPTGGRHGCVNSRLRPLIKNKSQHGL